MSDQDPKASSWGERREMLATAREGFIVVAIAMLFVSPSLVRDTLERAGISSFAGVEFDYEEIVNANDQVVEAHNQVAELAEQMNAIETQLAAFASAGRSATPKQVESIATALKTLKTKSESIDANLCQSSRLMGKAVELMPPEKLRELIERNRKQPHFLEQSDADGAPSPSAEPSATVTNPLPSLQPPPQRFSALRDAIPSDWNR